MVNNPDQFLGSMGYGNIIVFAFGTLLCKISRELIIPNADKFCRIKQRIAEVTGTTLFHVRIVPLLHMMLNCVFGGKGVGLMNMVMYVILAVFICGLMVGRTPEYLNKKIEGKEMKLVAICILIHPLLILGFSALAVAVPAGLEGITNPGYHGLTQVLYEFASSAANNGSGFEGLADNTAFWNITAGLAMFFGRYIAIIAQLAIAGSMLAKKKVNETVGTLRTDNITFMIILVFIVYIFAALTFFPALALGPIAEHLSIWM